MNPKLALKGVSLEVTNRGPQADEEFSSTREGTRVRLGYYGWFWFRYGEFAGPVQFVDHEKCVFFPEDFWECTGYGYHLTPGVECAIEKIWSNGVTGTAQQVWDGVVDAVGGDLRGARQSGEHGLAGYPPKVIHTSLNKFPLLKGYISKTRR